MKNIFKSKRNILIMMFALVILMGIGFAAYRQQLQINDTSSIDSDWNVYIKDVSVPDKSSSATGSGSVDETTNLKANLTTDLKYPGDYVIYKLIVANDGNIDAVLEKINFSMEKEGTVIKYYYSVDDRATWNEVTAEKKENPYNEDLLAKTTDDFYVKVEYDPTKTGTATENQKSNKLTIEFIYAQKTGSGVVPSVPKAAEMLKEKVTTTGDGLYEDEYEEGRHVYKGANPNNYITFNEENDGVAGWRIFSVEADNTIKLVKSDSVARMAFDSGTRTTGYCSEGSSFGCNAWAKTPNFVNGTLSGKVDSDSELNIYLNDKNNANSYYNKLSEKSKTLIQSHNFDIGPVEVFNDNISNQITSEKSITWNGNIGLINFSEFLRANSNKVECGNFSLLGEGQEKCNGTNYLLTLPKETSAWIISPTKNSSWDGFTFSENGFGPGDGTTHYNSVFPVLYLNDNITLSGDGTSTNPYTIN